MPELQRHEIEALEKRLYNATLTSIRECTPRLRVMRVRPDAGLVPHSPGQYLAIGLGTWHPRADGGGKEILPEGAERELMIRHYSFSHPILAPGGTKLVERGALAEYEFYVGLPDSDNGSTEPRFTPRLFSLAEGDRLYSGDEPAGEYTIDPVGPGEDVLFVATGTGEAPHNALIWDLMSRGHEGRIASVVCTRFGAEQCYRETHERLEKIRPGYRHLPLVTREPDAAARGMRVQEYLATGALEKDLGWELDPRRANVFLCGHPGMIGVPSRRPGSRTYPNPEGMIEILERRGFNADPRNGERVSIHYERFW